jgi:hypothetical protein
MFTFHSTHLGVDGTDNGYFVTLYVQCPPCSDVLPFNVADLTQKEANGLAAMLERVGDRLALDDLLAHRVLSKS